MGNTTKSQNDMTWNFDCGGKLKFSYFADSFKDFQIRFQGKEYNYIGIDEITHISYENSNTLSLTIGMPTAYEIAFTVHVIPTQIHGYVST